MPLGVCIGKGSGDTITITIQEQLRDILQYYKHNDILNILNKNYLHVNG